MPPSIHKSAVISPLNTTCRLPKDISNLLMEIWWAASLMENKWHHYSDRPGNGSSWNTESLWGEDASAEIALCMKRLLLFTHNTCHFHRRQLWCLRLNCGNFAEDPTQRVESFDSIASSSLFTHGNWKIKCMAQQKATAFSGQQGERVEGKTLQWSVRHFGNKFGKKSRNGNESMNSGGHETRERFHYRRHWRLCSFSLYLVSGLES